MAGIVKINVPEELKSQPLKPGDVSLRGIERTESGVYMVTFAWCDMLGVTHEKAFERGDIYTNFDKVRKIMTDNGLPFDPSKKADFHSRLCQLSTVMVKKEEPVAQNPT